MAELVLVLLGCGVAWVIGLLLWPFAPCTRCQGTGRNAGSTGRRFGTCRKCGGSGRRQRLGSRQVRNLLRIRRG